MKTNLLPTNAAINVVACTAAQNNYCSPIVVRTTSSWLLALLHITHTCSVRIIKTIDNKTMLLLMFIFYFFSRNIFTYGGVFRFMRGIRSYWSDILLLSLSFYLFIFLLLLYFFFLSRFVWYRFFGHYNNVIPLLSPVLSRVRIPDQVCVVPILCQPRYAY